MDSIELDVVRRHIFNSTDPSIIADREALMVSIKLLDGAEINEEIKERKRRAVPYQYEDDSDAGTIWLIVVIVSVVVLFGMLTSIFS